MKRAAAFVFALMLSLMIATPASAFWVQGATWPQRVVNVCESWDYPFPYRSMWNTVLAGFQAWNGYTNFTYADGGRVNCNVWVHYLSEPNGVPARSGRNIVNGRIWSADVIFNAWAGSDFWWYGATENCYVGSNCHMDAYSIAMHEAGHVLGLEHPKFSTQGSCGAGWYKTAYLNACDNYGDRVMFWAAGAEVLNCACPVSPNQGYRRALHIDDITGIRYLYP